MNTKQTSTLIKNMTKSFATATSEQGVIDNKVTIQLGEPEIVLPGGLDLGFGNTNTPVSVSIACDFKPVGDFAPVAAVWSFTVGFYFADCDLNNPDFKYSSEVWNTKLAQGDSRIKWLLPDNPDGDVVNSDAAGLSSDEDQEIYMALISNIFNNSNKDTACGFFDAVLNKSCALYEEQKTEAA